MNKGTLILMCGLPGAGKTTIAKKLEDERKANRLCPDDWIMAILENKKDTLERDRLRGPIEHLLWREAQSLLAIGVTVILENGFWAKEERNMYLSTAKKLGAKVELHFADALFDVLWQRVERRSLNEEEFSITKKEMEDGYKLFQPPTDSEGQIYDLYKHYNS